MGPIEKILEFEKQAVDRYRQLADSCASHQGIRRILRALTDDHARHAALLSSLENATLSGISDSGVFTETRVFFENIKAQKQPYSCDLDQLLLYREALALIQKKLRLYSEAAENMEQEKDKEVMRKIAADEKKHAVVLENIIAMVSRPENWIEDAEFNHLEEY